jgi:hypothetical protein
VSLTFHSALRKLNTDPSIGASHHISAHFGKAVSEMKIFRNHKQFLFLIDQFLNSFSSETAWPNDMKLGKKQIWKVLYRICSFRFDPLTNMAATGNSCFRLVDF